MRIVRFDNGPVANYTEYEVGNIDIRQATVVYGRSNDTMELYDDDETLVARAIWPIGSKCYKYSYGKNLDPNPSWCNYIY